MSIAGMLACFITVPAGLGRQRKRSCMEQLCKIDYIGLAILSTSLLCFLIPLLQVR